MKATLIDGNPLCPSSTDLFSLTLTLPIEEVPSSLCFRDTEPTGQGWRILTGNVRSNFWGAVAYRFEIEQAFPELSEEE